MPHCRGFPHSYERSSGRGPLQTPSLKFGAKHFPFSTLVQLARFATRCGYPPFVVRGRSRNEVGFGLCNRYSSFRIPNSKNRHTSE